MRRFLTIALACFISITKSYTTHNYSLWNDYEAVDQKPIGTGTRGVARLVRLVNDTVGEVKIAKIYAPKSYWEIKQVENNLARELPMQSIINSTFVPKLYQVYQDRSKLLWAIIMDYAGPISLQRLVKRIAIEFQVNHNESVLKFVTGNLLKALHDIHRKEVAHGDLFMYNIVVDPEGYLNIIDFDKAISKPPLWMKGRDTQQLGRILYRIYAVTPESSIFPSASEIHKRYSQRLPSGSFEEFVSLCVKPVPVEDLMKHEFVEDFDWDVLERRARRSPLSGLTPIK